MMETTVYCHLNELAVPGGVVIFGGEADKNLPLCELKQAFELQDNLYNRSIAGLSVHNGAQIFDSCVAPLKPEDIFLHIGEADRELFERNAAGFDARLSALLRHMKSADKTCRIAIIPMKDAPEMNQHLSAVAKSEGCEFCNMTQNWVWNPQQAKDVLSFVYSTGFVRPLSCKRPVHDLAKILFCCT